MLTPAGWRPPTQCAGDLGSCEHQGLQRTYSEPGDRTHEQDVSSGCPVVDECRAGGEPRGHCDARGCDPEPRDPPSDLVALWLPVTAKGGFVSEEEILMRGH